MEVVVEKEVKEDRERKGEGEEVPPKTFPVVQFTCKTSTYDPSLVRPGFQIHGP